MRAPLAFILLSFLSAGCGGSQKSFDGAVYRNGNVAFQVPPAPAAWRRIELENASLAYRDDARDAAILVNGRCGGKDDDTPLASLTAHLIMGTTERDFIDEKTVPFDGREARHTLLRAKLDGVPRIYDIFVVKKDGCVYDFVYIAPPAPDDAGGDAVATAEFERFAFSFHTLGRGAL